MKKLIGLLLVLNGVLLCVIAIDRTPIAATMAVQPIDPPADHVESREPLSPLVLPLEQNQRAVIRAGQESKPSDPTLASKHRPSALNGPTFAAQSVIPETVDRGSHSVDESADLTGPAPVQTRINPPVHRLPIVLLSNGAQSDQPLADETPSESDEVLARLQDEFVEKIGGPDQDPNDPEYASRWMNAVVESDQTFKALYGKQAFLAKELAAAQEAFEQAGR